MRAMKIDKLLRRVASLIVSACDPERIVLFGSYAKGQQNIDSDIDILVIGDFKGSCFLLKQELQQLLHFCPILIDINVATLQEVEAETAKPLGFLSSALSRGIVIYQKGKFD